VPASNQCPKCLGKNAQRSRRRNLIETIISKAGIKPFRCLGCNHRFFAFRLPAFLGAAKSGRF